MSRQTTIGKTAPVPLGQQKAINSLPVVFAEDQPPIPVEEQNKVQSDVALSLLGIPRAEVALGIFADVNTYDINPTEWSQSPLQNEVNNAGVVTTGLKHLAEEAGAELTAAEGRTTILSSKRFFRYQPGRVSSSTMGVKMNITGSASDIMKGAPSLKKWGIFDKYDGYYFEIANSGEANDFRCVRRTQALTPSQPEGVGSTPEGWNKVIPSIPLNKSNINSGNWGVVGVDPVIFRNGLCYVAAAIYDPSLCYAPETVRAVEGGADLNDYEYEEGYAVRLAYRNSGGSFVEHMTNRQFQFPFDQKIIDKGSSTYQQWKNDHVFLKPESEYIRLDAHCRWEDLVTNLSRGGGTGFTDEIAVSGDSLGVNIDNARFGYDSAPNEINSGVKVWNLLVSVQGSVQVSNAQYTAAFPSAHRTSAYDVDSSDIGRKNITLKEWFKICVPPQYRVVYEWRPVRAMFSGDQLNGELNQVRWSDVSTANVDPSDISVKRPGDPIFVQSEPLEVQSQYKIDFTKVTMWKIEFSWYGAVGALFLCYVPVSNGEARWVRVHHMRASNQLDVASLGNATLPITYLTHGGISSGLSTGNKLVKYGASYYIDGGDKGTVKLLSKSSDYAKSLSYGVLKTIANNISANRLDISFTQAQREQLIGSYLKNDSTTKVIWVENNGGGVRLYFNTDLIGVTSPIELVIPRRQRAMSALRAKNAITNTTGTDIRNRLQLYPIKYGIGLTDPTTDNNILSINFLKNPLLITNNLDNSILGDGLTIELYTDSLQKTKGFELGSGTTPIKLQSNGNITSAHYTTLNGVLSEGKYFFAYMRSLPTTLVGGGFGTTPSTSETSTLVRFFKKFGEIYIQNYNPKQSAISVYGNPLYVKMYNFNQVGDLTLFTGIITHTKYEDQTKWNDSGVGLWESIAPLSGAAVSQDFKLAPVPDTGSTIFSLYVNKGGSQFDLQDYFAYNKEYISYPLTNEVDILCTYAFWESTTSLTTPSDSLSIVNSLTWEEQ